MTKHTCIAKACILFILFLQAFSSNAQQLLNTNISLSVNRQPLNDVLEIISNKGSFYFSYNSNIIPKGSLVSVTVNNNTVKDVLTGLLGPAFEFRESGNYIIIRRMPIKLRLVTSAAVSEDRFYTVSGYVIDDQTGEKISDASIYEKDRLVVSSTNSQGFFKIRLKSRYRAASITVSKEYYADTTVTIEPKLDQSLTVVLMPLDINEHTVTIGPAGMQAPESINLEIPVNDSLYWLYRYEKRDSVLVEKTALGRFLVSSRAKLLSINLKKFFVARPFQVSAVPGLSTNGALNSQVINNFSFNIFGGYSGGTNGFELGGLFNIDKKSVQYAQIGGLFNIVGDHLNGLQIGGISNTVLDSVRGVQVGGISNFVKTKFSGVQVGGIYNHTGQSFDGAQIAGVANYTNHRTHGAQIAGISNVSLRKVTGAQIAGVANYTGGSVNGIQIGGVANVSVREVRGVQISGVLNYTRRLRGVQVGLINISDTSDGYSIGLINIVFKGYHKLSLSANETINANAAFKTGNSKLYSIFMGGYNTVPDQKLWSYGYGIGTEFKIGGRFSLNPELTAQQLYLGSWDYYNILNRASLQLTFKISRMFSLFAGPVYSVFVSDQDVHFTGYKVVVPSSGYGVHKFGNTVNGWVGWSVGVNIF